MKFEGGFQGRTNKLVDGCYSFWCAAILPIAQAILSKKGMYKVKWVSIDYTSSISILMFLFICIEPELSQILKQPVFDARSLQEYIFICCQAPTGGLIDKPDT